MLRLAYLQTFRLDEYVQLRTGRKNLTVVISKDIYNAESQCKVQQQRGLQSNNFSK
jgi:hypothetical protein